MSDRLARSTGIRAIAQAHVENDTVMDFPVGPRGFLLLSRWVSLGSGVPVFNLAVKREI